MDYSSIAKLPNMGPGSQGSNVLALQKWLVANNFMTQADMNTGPGIYGPKTTASVAKWQQQAGFDTQGNPGWFGPLSKSYIQTQAQPKTSTQTTQQQISTTTPQVSQQKILLSAVADVAQTAAATGKPPLSFADALKAAQNDPNIVAKYSDMAKMDTQAFTQALQQYQTQYGTQADLYKTQFENERKQLAEKQAQAGTAYSGFREQAKQQLGQQESGIVTSARSQLQQGLNQLTSAFESKYGTAATPWASITATNPLLGGTETITGEKAGGITGGVSQAKQADITSSALKSYQTAQFPQI